MSLLRGCGGDATNYLAVATEFALHDPFDLSRHCRRAAKHCRHTRRHRNYSLSVSSVIKPFVVVLEVRRFRRHRRSFRLRFLRRPPL